MIILLQIAICDDETANVSRVQELAKVFFRTHCIDIKLHTYESGENLMYDLKDGFYFDLLLLDIEMPEVTGMDLAEVIKERMPSARIIFITSHLQYAIEAYEFSIFRYIPKDKLEDKLPAALEDFYKLYRLERNEYYTIQVKNHIEQLAYRDILYVLRDGKYAVFHLINGESKSVRKTLSQVSEELNQEYFYFADRGCIVNFANVTGLDDSLISFVQGQQVPISKAMIPEFKMKMLEFWGKQI